MPKSNVLINLEQRNVVKVRQGESFTVPESSTQTSPTQVPTGFWDTKRPAVGGSILPIVVADDAGPAAETFDGWDLKPGDVVACSAVASNTITVTVNGVTVHQITGVTTFGAVFIVWG